MGCLKLKYFSNEILPEISRLLGSGTWITYTDGEAIQHLHYLPFGEEQIDQRLTSFNSRYTFSAKEKDVETNYSYFGARYYTSDLSIWLSVDPLSDKYPSLSPYNYCANNPIRITDPNGMEWEIDGIKYTPGAACPEGVEQKTQDKWNTMNKTYETKNGKKAIDEMNKKGVMYKVSSETQSANAGGSYQSNGDGTGGTLYLNGNDNNKSTLSHEMFHGYQDMYGQGGRSIHNEVEAMLFEHSVSTEYGFANGVGFLGSPLKGKDDVYDDQVDKMTNDYSSTTMNSLISGFKQYSGANVGGTYNDYPEQRENQKRSLIQGFYPLMQWKK
jgi:RHS repeat-associated protein